MTPNNFRVKSGLTVGTTISGGNTTITGFVNATSSVNAASHTVGTAFVANSTGITTTGFANVAGGLSLTNGTTNFINWSTAGVDGPSINVRSPGTKLLLYPALSVSQTDYAIGISPATIWSTVPSNDPSFKFKWYGADIEVASLGGTGNFVVAGSINAASYTVGTSFVANTSRVSFGTAVGLEANGGIGTAGQVLHSNGTTIYWAADDQGVTSVAAANGLNGGTITSTGTISVLGGSTLTVNTTGVHVNSTLSLTDLTLSGNLTVSGTRTYVNTTTLDVGDNIITLNADLGASAPSQDAGIEIMRGTSANVQFIWDETNDRWSTNGQPMAVSSLVAAGAASGITTLAAGNTTITGFVNASASVNSAVLAVGTSFVANTTQVTAGIPVRLNNAQQLRFQTVNTSAYAYFTQQNDDNFVFYTSNTSYGARAVFSVYANTANSAFDVTVPLKPSAGIVANGSFGSAGQVLKTNGTTSYWDTAGGTGTVTSVATANGLSGGPITTTGTLGVVTGSTLTVNSTGIHVNSALAIASLSYSGSLSTTNTSLYSGATGSTILGIGSAIVSANTQGGRAYEGSHDFNSYPNLYSSVFINTATATNVPSGMSGVTYRFAMGAGDVAARGFDLVGANGQLWWRARDLGNTSWSQAFTTAGGTLSGNIAMSNNNITNPILTGYTEHEVANAAVTGTFTMNCAAANFFDLTLTGNTTISPSNVPPSTRVWSGSIAAKQDATGGRTITWPAGTKYAGGVAPPATTTANALDIWSLMTYDGGTSWIVSLSVKGVA